LVSEVCVCGVHCVMAKGVHTDGIVLAKFASVVPCFKADAVVLEAVPDSGLTYLTRLGACANTPVYPANSRIKIDMRAFSIL